MKLSHSSMSTYTDCPKKYFFKYIEHMKEKAKHFFSFGNSIHKPLEFMYQNNILPSLDQVLTVYKAKWLRAGYKNRIDEDKAKKLGESMLRDYYTKHAKTWKKPLAVEPKFEMNIDHVRVNGFIDRIDITEDGGLAILDYKTGKPLDTERIDTDEQLTMYQMGAEHLYPGQFVTELGLYHVPSLTLHKAKRRGNELIRKLKEKIVRIARAITQKEFQAIPGEKVCGWCDFKPHCPEWKEGA